MFDQIYDWLRTVSLYLILISAVMQAVPGKDYKRYVRFFSGLVLILLLFTPLLKLTGMEERFDTIYSSSEYETAKKEIESASRFYEEITSGREASKDAGTSGKTADTVENPICVEEIEIGK